MAQVCRMDGEVGASLVCIDSVLSLAVVSAALQKLHKCVTQNTTELLQDTQDEMVSTGGALPPSPLMSASGGNGVLPPACPRANRHTHSHTRCPDPPRLI